VLLDGQGEKITKSSFERKSSSKRKMKREEKNFKTNSEIHKRKTFSLRETTGLYTYSKDIKTSNKFFSHSKTDILLRTWHHKQCAPL
jgi:hypothetical protein